MLNRIAMYADLSLDDQIDKARTTLGFCRTINRIHQEAGCDVVGQLAEGLLAIQHCAINVLRIERLTEFAEDES